MKRFGAILCLAMIIVLMAGSFCFATTTSDFDLVSTYPKDGDSNKSIDNFSIKLQFNQDVLNEANEKNNAKCITVKDAEGKVIPMKLFYSPKEKGLVMALADVDPTTQAKRDKKSREKALIVEDMEYTVTISGDFLSADGDTLGTDKVIKFTTLNQSRATTINMVMMLVMFGGMFVFSNQSMKKQEEKKSKEKGEKVNPYKKAKETGKSVEEIVAKDQKEKQKKAVAEARRVAKNSADREVVIETATKHNPDAYRVKAPKPVSAGGSTYITGRKSLAEAKALEAKQRGTTNPKNKSGKQAKKKK